MGLFEVLALLLLCLVIWLFWQTRIMAEKAKRAIDEYCESYGLQVLAIARTKLQPSRNEQGHFCWKATYQFEFSSDGESYYLGYAILNGIKLLSIDTPAYRQP